MCENSAPHYHGHRQVLQSRFLKGGAATLQDHELLELLLTFAFPHDDVTMLANGLIQHFGSFSQVMDATPEELAMSLGSQDSSVILLNLVKACAEYYLKQEALKRRTIDSPEALAAYCRIAMGGLKNEQFRTIFLNCQNEIIAEEIVQEGMVCQAVIHPRKVLELALRHKAFALILVHNHPGGSLAPSASDRQLTRALVKAAKILGLTVLDHLIITRHGYFSLAEQNML